MVVTRRGLCVSSQAKTDSDSAAEAQATPSTGRRTRRTAKRPESPTQSTVEKASLELEKIVKTRSPSASARKRCTRASRLHSPDKPCTPLGSVHEGDVSDLDSCCSALSDIDAPVTRRSTRRKPRPVEDDVSEVESCSSAISASRAEVRRSTRKNKIPVALDSAGDVNDDNKISETESQSQRGKGSRTATEDSEMSEVDSVTGEASQRAVRGSSRSRRQLPIHLEETSDSQSPAPTRRTRATRGKPAETVSEPVSCDSEGVESLPSCSRMTRSRRKTQSKVTDSDVTDVSKGSPSSSRTGSGSSSRLAQDLAVSPQGPSAVSEKEMVPPGEDSLFDESRLETTVTEEDAECTLIEKEECTTSNETTKEAETPPEKIAVEEGSNISHDCSTLASAVEPAVTAEDQQEEPCADSVVQSNSEMKMMQKTEPLQAAFLTATCDSDCTGNKDEAMEDTDITDNNKAPRDGDGDLEMSEREEMEDISVSEEAQQVVDVMKSSETEDKPMEATSSQNQSVPEEGFLEEPFQASEVQSKNIISLLDSSEDEDDDEEFACDEGESSEDEVDEKEPKKSDTAKSVDGLFMIDTRPGQEADEHYYREKAGEEEQAAEGEEEDEEFVDEEGDDDDDEGELLLYSRNPQNKDLSSRIDPGIRLKELGGLYISFDGTKSNPVSSSQQKTKEKKIQDEVMKKSVIGPDFEKKDALPPYKESKHALKLKRRAEREKTTGDSWFNMKAPEMTQELKGDLQLLKMRGSTDPKRFYKKNDRDGFPKYFQMGTVVDNPVDFYHSRISKKERKRTMVEELLADAEFRHKNKKKFQAIMAEKASQASGRRHKMKNKFHKK